ncbi:DUF2306 domain-containing protein [uncultured Arcticibacterium sp.]|uniref:DUF2306 domain-containing protein n=1 Tax=uncultured Arcticibacterium sp. TaxID=2173042 RepID=UPI0030F7E03B
MKQSKSLTYYNISRQFWFLIIFIGQAIFTYYILFLYGKNGIEGNFEKWNTATPHGYVSNDILGNIFFGIHVALAAIITIGGPLQLIPAIRKNLKKFHRINGRVYLLSAVIISLSGLYLTWVRGSVGGLVGSIAISCNAVAILVSAFCTVKYALAKNFLLHQKWAVHLFLAVSGVFFFRICLMFWLGVNQAPVGFNPKTFQGPTLNVLYVLVYILPVFISELFHRALKLKKPKSLIGMSLFLVITGLALAFGVFVATKGMWLPRL